MQTEEHVTRSPDETRDLAADLLSRHPGWHVFALHGDLGAGKTCFVQGLAAAMGIDRLITSPTFAIVNQHEGQRTLYHMDLYRIHGQDDASTVGLEDYLRAEGVLAIEWAERAEDRLPAETVHVYFSTLDEECSRAVRVVPGQDSP